MCMRERPTLVEQIGIVSVAVDRPKESIVIITARNYPSTTHIPRRQIRRVDLRDNLRERVALLLDQRGGDAVPRYSAARLAARTRAVSPSSAPETLSKNSSQAALILPPVSTMKGTKLLWSLWQCHCAGHGGPRHAAWAVRVIEGNEPDQRARASFADDPLHGLYSVEEGDLPL